MKHLQWQALWQLMRFHKPVGLWLLLWPTWQTYWLITPPHKFWTLTLLTAGVVIMRATGCVINDLCDRHFDGHVPRTANRPLVTGAITVKQAYCTAALGLLIAIIIALQLPKLCWYIAIYAGLITIVYPLSKRWMPCPQFLLGLAFACPVLMVTAACYHQLSHTPWWLFLQATIWPIAYDTLYAMADKPADKSLPIKSSAQWLGQHDWFAVIMLYSFCGACWLAIAWQHQSYIILIGLVVASAQLIPHLKNAKTREAHLCFEAFKANQWLGGWMTLAILLQQFF